MKGLWQTGKTLCPAELIAVSLLHRVVEEELSNKNDELSLAEVALRDGSRFKKSS